MERWSKRLTIRTASGYNAIDTHNYDKRCDKIDNNTADLFPGLTETLTLTPDDYNDDIDLITQ